MNFGRGSGDADLGFHKRALGSNLPALMPQCNECPLNSMEHASTEHSVNSYLLLVIQLNGEQMKLWFSLIQTTLYAIKLSCTHHTLECSKPCLSVCLSLFPCSQLWMLSLLLAYIFACFTVVDALVRAAHWDSQPGSRPDPDW